MSPSGIWAVSLSLLLGVNAVQAQDARSVVVANPTPVKHATALQLSGQISAAQRAELSPRLSGVVEALAVDVGAKVQRGDRLLKLDDRLASLESMSAKAALAAAKARLQDAERIERETLSLTAQGLLPSSQGETARTALAVARAEARASEAQTALIAERLQRHWLTAPFDGVIVGRSANVGEWVDASSAVMVLISNEALRFDARVPQELFGQIDTAGKVEVRIDGREAALTGAVLQAEVPAGDSDSRSFLLRLELPAQTPALLPGASGTVSVTLRGNRQTFSVPRDALVTYPDGGRAVWLAVPSDGGYVATSQRIEIDAGLSDPMRVLSGIDGDDRVIVRGFSRLRDGEAVLPSEAN